MKKWNNQYTVCTICTVQEYVICHSSKVLEELENAHWNAWKVLEFDFEKGVGTLHVL